MRTSRVAWVATWTILAASLVAPVAFVIVRAVTPSDGARVAFYDGAWSSDGVAIQPIDAPAAGLAAGDIVLTVGGRSLEAWLGDLAAPAAERPNGDAPVPYDIRRAGSDLALDVAWSRPSLWSTLLDGWSFVVFSIAFAAVAALVFARRPDEPAAVPLVLAACGAAGSTVPWFLGVTTSDLVQGGPFLLHTALTGPLYMLLWPAGLHLALVFPARHPILGGRRWLLPGVYAMGFAGYAGALLAGRLASPTTLEWIGTWPVAQLAVVVPLTTLTLAVLARRYATTPDPVPRAQMRLAALGTLAAGAITLAVFWLPQLLLGRPLLDWSWLGVVALAAPLGLAAAILRDRLFDIDVVVARTLVYGGLTLGVVATYVAAAAMLGAIAGSREGYGVSLLATGAAALVALPLRDVLQRAVNRLMYGHRDEPWRAMRLLGQRLEWAADPDRAFPAIVDTVADSLRLPHVALAVADDRGAEQVVAIHGEARGATVRLPLVHGAERVGSLVLGVRAGETGFHDAELGLLADLARQAGTAIGAIRLRADLARSRERLVLAREEERRRLRRDLHDGLGPSLAAIGMRAEAATAALAGDPPTARRLLDELGADVGLALADIRRLVDGLRPPALDELGLLGAIEEQATRLGDRATGPRTGMAISIEGRPVPLPDLPAAVEVAAYRIAVEALTNAVRHSGAATCRVRVEASESLTLEVTDDGRGLPPDVAPGVGLESIRARAAELGGGIRLERPGSGGTRVIARLPLGPASS